MSQAAIEHVLVVPTALFHALGHFQGFCAEADRYLGELFNPEHASYRPRPAMEQDPSYKQLIPYCVFAHRGAAGWQVFQYTRGKGQGEGRLRQKRSIGVGGHISSLDARLSAADPYREGMRRELEEEVAIESPYVERCVGLINDDETDVGRVHLGVVHLFELELPLVRPREAEMVDCGFEPVDKLWADRQRLETWSAICLPALFASETGMHHA